MNLHWHRYEDTVERWAATDADNIIHRRNVLRCIRCGKIMFRGERFLDWDAQNLAYRMRQTTDPDLPPRDPFSSPAFVAALAAQDNPPMVVFWPVTGE